MGGVSVKQVETKKKRKKEKKDARKRGENAQKKEKKVYEVGRGGSPVRHRGLPGAELKGVIVFAARSPPVLRWFFRGFF